MILTKNGTNPIAKSILGTTGNIFVIYTSGVFGGATVEVQYKNGLGQYKTLQDGALAVDTQTEIRKGRGVDLFITVTGATGTTEIDIITAVSGNG